jgi:enamine deaminase RidA (YjgF/YER057c/UK114 family)
MRGRKRVFTNSPYEDKLGVCRAVRAGSWVAVSGTAPLGPDGTTVARGNPAAQARRCFEIVRSAIEELDGTLSDVVRTRILLTRIADWKAVAAVHGEFFGDVRPVTTIVQVGAFIDPDWLVEVEADALVRDSESRRNE